jgi:hypothetical protein
MKFVQRFSSLLLAITVVLNRTEPTRACRSS